MDGDKRVNGRWGGGGRTRSSRNAWITRSLLWKKARRLFIHVSIMSVKKNAGNPILNCGYIYIYMLIIPCGCYATKWLTLAYVKTLAGWIRIFQEHDFFFVCSMCLYLYLGRFGVHELYNVMLHLVSLFLLLPQTVKAGSVVSWTHTSEARGLDRRSHGHRLIVCLLM